ncbi:MAG: IS200/IS605 family transposase [Deltaproteobacteria bacterium]|nr:IS200/IS605 family transposase [Deltaproteobacteria bacterium]
MSELIRKSHNVSVLIYHYVCPAKYRRVVIDKKVDEIIKQTCLEITKRYETKFIEIGTDREQVHFLIQSIPRYSPTKIIQTVKSITAREVFRQAPEVKKQLWGGEFWSDGYYVSTVGRYGSEETIRKYVQNQGESSEYKQLHTQQLSLFN